MNKEIKMLDELFSGVCDAVDKAANTDEGHKLVDDMTSIIGRAFKNLIDQGICQQHAALIISGMVSKTGAK